MFRISIEKIDAEGRRSLDARGASTLGVLFAVIDTAIRAGDFHRITIRPTVAVGEEECKPVNS